MERRVLLAVTGCAQAEITPRLVRSLASHRRVGPLEVIVAATDAALEFFDRSRVERSTGRPVFVHHRDATAEFPVPHVSLAEWADLLLVYPAPANTLAKCAAGICDNLVCTLPLAARGPVYFGPVMNDAMAEHPITRTNLDRLEAAGYRWIPREPARVRVRSSGRAVRRPFSTETMVLSVCDEVFDRRGRVAGGAE
jgi:phosphopantothenoylcysteine decarboxylase/phosphopantothenate--cysteine ligase